MPARTVILLTWSFADHDRLSDGRSREPHHYRLVMDPLGTESPYLEPSIICERRDVDAIGDVRWRRNGFPCGYGDISPATLIACALSRLAVPVHHATLMSPDGMLVIDAGSFQALP